MPRVPALSVMDINESSDCAQATGPVFSKKLYRT